MKFKTKMFISIFSVSAVLVIGILGIMYWTQRASIRKQYFARYQSFGEVLATTFQQMDYMTDLVNSNAVYALKEIERRSGVPSPSDLEKLVSQLNVKGFYVINSNGNFLRSTDMPVEKQTNSLFDYCSGYRNLINGGSNIEKTPIIPSFPLGIPAKFVMIPNHDRSLILESGTQLDFLSKSLLLAVRADPNIETIGLFAPTGYELGSISKNGAFSQGKAVDQAVLGLGARVVTGNRMIFTTRVPASVENCCECAIKKVAADGSYYYILKAEVSLLPMLTELRSATFRLALLCLLSLGLAFVLAQRLSTFLVRRLTQIHYGLQSVMNSGDLSLRLNIDGSDEFHDLGLEIDKMIAGLESGQEERIQSARVKSLHAQASQVAHDIRSPMAALSMLEKQMGVLPEEIRIMVRNALARIRDISNQLLEQNKAPTSAAQLQSEHLGVHWVSSVLEDILSEKRVQYRSKIGVTIENTLDSQSYSLFASVQLREFKRVISNLVNNAVEAFEEKGKITVTLRPVLLSRNFELVIADNGKGISEDVLTKLGEKGVSHDKPSGSGLGLSHAIESIKSWGGSLRLESKVEVGTQVIVTLPKENPPAWFVSELVINAGTEVVIFDDDSSIHGVWQGRFESLNYRERDLVLSHFSTPDELRQAVKLGGARPKAYLMDFELLGFSVTGLDLIAELELGSQAILVTSRYEESQIQRRCLELGVRLIPKSMVAFVPVSIREA